MLEIAFDTKEHLLLVRGEAFGVKIGDKDRGHYAQRVHMGREVDQDVGEMITSLIAKLLECSIRGQEIHTPGKDKWRYDSGEQT
jgi:hypothetical protein